MSLVYTHRGGLVVAEHAADERAVQAALRRLDPELVLTQDFCPAHQQLVWAVVRRNGSDRPVTFICEWRDEHGAPLPLTFRLVDKVDALRADSRAPRVDVMAENDRMRAEQDAAFGEYADEFAREFVALKRDRVLPCLPRGAYLRRARARAEEAA